MNRKKNRLLFVILFFCILISGPLYAVNWEKSNHERWKPVFEDEKRDFFGSEKDKRYYINALIVEGERWDGHSSLMFLWLFKSTDYPKFTSARILPFYYKADSKISDRYIRSVPILLFYHEHDGSETVTVNPLFGYYTNTSDFTDYSDSKYTKYPAKETKSISLLHYYENRRVEKKEGEKNINFTIQIPSIPLVRYNSTSFSTSLNLFWINNWEFKNGKLDSMIFLPLYFYKSDEYHHLFPLFLKKTGSNQKSLYLLSIYTSSDAYGSGSFFIFPLYFSTVIKSEKKYARYNMLLPLWRYASEEYGTTEKFSLLTPLFYHSRNTDQYRNESATWFPFVPVVYKSNSTSQGGDSSVFHIIPLYYSFYDNFTDARERVNMLLPLWVYYNRTSGSYKNIHLFTPLFYYSGEKNGERDTKGRLWLPGIPLLYSSHYDINGSEKSLLSLIHWGRDGTGEMKYFWFIPVIFHSFSEYGYTHIFPFYFRPEHNKESGYSFGLFPVNYHSWSAVEETKWYSLLFYSYRNIPAKRETFHIMPLYWSWNRPESEFTLFVPIYLDYKDKSKGRSLYVNLLGYSQSSLTGGVSASVDAGFNANSAFYIDTEFSWMYDVVSVGIKKTFGQKESGGQEDINVAASPSISREGGITRENSNSFFGWKLLFGILAYEKADTKRHFRLLPLSWLTWDENSSNSIKWILNYVSYKDGDKSYFVFFPFYGEQRIADSYTKAYLLTAFWDEYDSKEKLRERSILWPIVNFYDSPSRSGWRILPLAWHRETKTEDIHSSKTISLIYYGSEKKNIKDGTTISGFSISPLHIHFSDSSSSTTWFPVVPLLTRTISTEKNATNILGIIDWESYKNDNGYRFWIFPLFGIRGGDYSWKYIFPVFFSYSDNTKKDGSFHIMPLYFSWEDEYKKSFFALGWYHASGENIYRNNFLWLFDYHSNLSDSWGLSFLFGTIGYEKTRYKSEFELLYGLAFDYEKYMDRGYSMSFMLFLYRQKEMYNEFSNFAFPFWYYNSKLNSNDWYIISPPLLSYISREGNSSFDLIVLGALWYRNAEPDLHRERQMLLLGIPYYKVHRPERNYESRGSLWGFLWEYENEADTGYKKFSILKFLVKWTEIQGKDELRILGIKVH